ncbi:MAG: hypothetical protein M5U28_43710 [Sandaracinaceae bacterium]|nr:hypothetical protein [Sandaracinaceae bacterium]
MRRIRGRSLEQILEELAVGEPDALQRYSQRKLLDAFSRVCLSVDYAHRRGGRPPRPQAREPDAR